MDTQKLQAGDLRTKIRIQKYVKPAGGDDFTTGAWVDLDNQSADDPPKYIRCAWYPLGGSETWIAASTQVIDADNVIIRYRPDVTSQCRVVNDGVIYNIIAPNDPDQHKHWLKFKVKAAVSQG